jgi:hypothetical protein
MSIPDFTIGKVLTGKGHFTVFERKSRVLHIMSGLLNGLYVPERILTTDLEDGGDE